MDRPVELVPLVCLKCSTPVPAQPGEVAWACAQCQQGMSLDEEKGLVLLEIHYQGGIVPGQAGKPFWVAEGRVRVSREVYGSSNLNAEAGLFWSQPHLFFLPAFTCPLETLTTLGPRLLLQPPVLREGPPVGFEPVTLSSADVHAMVEFVVLAIEAGRKDKLKKAQIEVDLSSPVLWILP